MKILKPIQVEQLLKLLDKKPRQSVAHFSEGSHLLTKNLQLFCKANESTYYLFSIKDVFYEKSKTKYANATHINIVKFDLQSTTYQLQDRTYDYLISTLDFGQKNKSVFLEKCYPIIRNEGTIILITPTSDTIELNHWKSILNERLYRSVKIINTIFDDYDVIIAKCRKK